MIPILFERNETAFANNGLCRLRDTISAVVSEERNNIFELDFEYPVNGANYDQIEYGRIVGVTHDEDGDIQPFEIVSSSKPINGVVSFHAVHISYRQSQMVASGTGINSLADAFTMLGTATPSNPFTYETDMTSTGYMSSADGTPRSVRQFLGGVQGSILDTYGGEYEWDKWRVILHQARGELKDFSIRYGVNLLNYDEDTDYQNTFTSCIAFWKKDNDIITVTASLDQNGYNGNDICVPLDLSDKFEDKPTNIQLQNEAISYMNRNNTNLPAHNIKVDFVRLSELGEFAAYQDLLKCRLCDSIKVIFPMYNVEATFKIVKTEWDVLSNRYNSMELGTLSTTLAEALGISSSNANGTSGGGASGIDYIVDEGTDGIWTYRKWASGVAECWGYVSASSTAMTTHYGSMYYSSLITQAFPSGLFMNYPKSLSVQAYDNGNGTYVSIQTWTKDDVSFYAYGVLSHTISVGYIFDVKGEWDTTHFDPSIPSANGEEF